MKFKVGDIVEAFGIRGVILNIDETVFRMNVEFDGIHSVIYNLDGHLCHWHKEPSLKFIKRPKKYKEVTIETFGNIYPNEIVIVYQNPDFAFSNQTIDCLNKSSKLLKVTYLVEDKE